MVASLSTDCASNFDTCHDRINPDLLFFNSKIKNIRLSDSSVISISLKQPDLTLVRFANAQLL